MSQLATELRNRHLGKLQANIKTPKREGKEQCQTIKLRSGKEIPYRRGEIKEHISNHSANMYRERRKMQDKRSRLEHKNEEGSSIK